MCLPLYQTDNGIFLATVCFLLCAWNRFGLTLWRHQVQTPKNQTHERKIDRIGTA